MPFLQIGNLTIEKLDDHWRVQADGPHVRFPPTPEGYKNATRFAISVNYPAVEAAVANFSSRHPALAERAWRASVILCSGNLLPPLEDSDAVARVLSQSLRGDTFYEIHPEPDTPHFRCSCPDWPNAPTAHGAHLCKHVLAYRLALYLDIPLSSTMTGEQLARELFYKSQPKQTHGEDK
jgi:hypothetical protein